MSIWEHGSIGSAPIFNEIVLGQCRFCGTNGVLRTTQIKDRWCGIAADLESDLLTSFQAAVEGSLYGWKSGPDQLSFQELPAALSICPQCGWWHVFKEVFVHYRGHQLLVECGTSAQLRHFDMVDIHAPLNEVRQFLSARYEKRFDIHPRHFEEVVASVFRSLGFHTELSASSADGGIDVVLRDSHERVIAVQVKRYRDSIEVAQIRELLGAMVLRGYTKGVFVTTSRFQGGAKGAVMQAAERGMAVELVDGERFLQGLRIAQIMDFECYPAVIDEKVLSRANLRFGGSHHCRPLVEQPSGIKAYPFGSERFQGAVEIQSLPYLGVVRG